MRKISSWRIAALTTALLVATATGHAQQAGSGDNFDKDLERARRVAEVELKQAQAQQVEEEKKRAAEAAKEKKKQDAAEALRIEREKAESDRLAEEARRTKAEQRRQIQRERERSCVYKAVMTDAEIANCKQVWK